MRAAEALITGTTFAPCRINSRARVTVSTAAMEPLTARTTVLPRRASPLEPRIRSDGCTGKLTSRYANKHICGEAVSRSCWGPARPEGIGGDHASLFGAVLARLC